MSRTLLSVEFIVQSLDRALEVLVDVLGCSVVERRSSADPVGEVALVDAGGVVITLIEPAAAGPGFVLPLREPRISQLVFSANPTEMMALTEKVGNAGLAMADLPGRGFFITPESVKGALGIAVAIVATGIGD